MSVKNQVGTSGASAIARPITCVGGGVQMDQRGGWRGLFRRAPQTPGRSSNAGVIDRGNTTTADGYTPHETWITLIVNWEWF